MRRLFKQFSFPGGVPSHVAAEVPGSIHEGGELGYALSHAFGAAFDNPDLVVACVIGDGEAETGPLAASWHSNKFLDPVARRRGAADPAPQRLQDLQPVRARADRARGAREPAGRLRLEAVLRRGLGPGAGPPSRWPRRSTPRSTRSPQIQAEARASGQSHRPRWPMIVLRTPKGWTGPKEVDGLKTEDHSRSHQVPLCRAREPARPPRAARGVDAQLPARGALRRRRAARARAARARPRGRAAHGRQPARQRRHAAAKPADARLPRLRRRRPGARRGDRGGHEGARRVPQRASCGATSRRATSACSRRTRTRPTACRRCTRRPARRGWGASCPTTRISRPTGG